jgi:hypothetical protein
MHNAVMTEPADTEAMRIGRLAHEAVLNPAWPVPRWHAGHIPDTWSAAELRQMRAMRDAVLANDDAAALLASSTRQTTIEWTLPGSGGPATGTPDLRKTGILAEYKVTKSNDPHAFARQAGTLGYHVQLSYYRNGHYVLTGSTPAVHIIAQESTPPYSVRVYTVLPDVMDAMFAHALAAAEAYRLCEASGVYPPPDHAPANLEFPDWLLT